jgi:uncharacterized alpha-E superfamily protein
LVVKKIYRSPTGNFIISNQSGGISKDAWILSPEPSRILNVLSETPDRSAAAGVHDRLSGQAAAFNDMLPSHAAENLFWVGRYTERVLGVARFLRTVMQFVAEGNKLSTEPASQTERSLLVALTQYSYAYPGFTGEGSEAKFANPWAELKEILLNEKRAGSLKYNFLQLYRAIHEVREHWSTDTWRVLRVMEEEFRQDIPLTHHGHLQMLHTLDNLITFIVAFIGLNRESISREQGWILLDAGRKIEQSLLLITMLRTTLVDKNSELVEYNLQQSVLMSHESLVNYRYKYRMPMNTGLVLDFLLFDPNNPRSLTYQIDRLKAYLKRLPKEPAGHAVLKGTPGDVLSKGTPGHVPTEYERLILEADTLLKLADKQELAVADENEYSKLDELLAKMYGLLAALSEAISKRYFKHELSYHA